MTSKRSVFLRGMRDGLPVGAGYLAVSFAFGLAARRLGFTTLAASLMSFTNLTSAGQFAGAELIATGTTVIELALTQLVVNARYFLMSCSLSQRLDQQTGFLQRALMGWGISDEIFALSQAYPMPLSPLYTYGLMAICIPCWTLGTLLGASLGAVLSQSMMNALGIALYAMLTAAIVPHSQQDKTIRLIIVVSMSTSGLAAILPMLRDMPGGLRIVLLTVVITSLTAWRFPLKEEQP